MEIVNNIKEVKEKVKESLDKILAKRDNCGMVMGIAFDGCVDRNGKQIGTGDIVKFGEMVGIVNFDIHKIKTFTQRVGDRHFYYALGFYVEPINYPENRKTWYRNVLSEELCRVCIYGDRRELELIGNIFDEEN